MSIPKESDKLMVGDTVVRKQVNAFRYHRSVKGVIVEITSDGRNRIRWDDKNKTGQQHSTIQTKFLQKINN